MNQILRTDLTKAIINILISIPGVVGMVNKQTEAAVPNKLSNEHLSKGIELTQNKKGYDLKVFIIIALDVRSEIIAREIYQALKFFEQTQPFKFISINIFIKGIR